MVKVLGAGIAWEGPPTPARDTAKQRIRNSNWAGRPTCVLHLHGTWDHRPAVLMLLLHVLHA